MGEQQFILRWHYHENTLMRNLPHLLDSDILTDITLSAGSQFIKAHRLVLATCSSYFLQLFQSMGSTQHPVLILHNTTYEDLQAVISFMYRGQCLVTKTQLPSLLSLARLLQIQGLCDMKVPEQKLIPISTKSLSTNDYENASDEADPYLNLVNEYYKKSTLVNNNSSNIPPENDAQITKQNEFNTIVSSSLERYGSNREYLSIDLDQQTSDYDLSNDNVTPRKQPKDLTYKCFLCGKYLSNQYNLRVHMETHKDGYHACQSCPHISRSRDALRKHVSYRHPEESNARKRKKSENI